MNERGQTVGQTDCYQESHTEDRGNVLVRDLVIERDGKKYEISVTTSAYLENLRSYNEQFEPEVRLDENAYVLGDLPSLPSVEEICYELSQIPLETLNPFLKERQSILTNNLFQTPSGSNDSLS